MSCINFQLTPVLPFRLDLTVWALRRNVSNNVDRWNGQIYRRVFVHDGAPVTVAAMQSESLGKPILEVTASGEGGNLKGIVTGILERSLGLNIDLSPFYRFAADNKVLEPLARRFLGVKPPRFPTVFEAVANGIACQQVSLAAGIGLLNRLSESYGKVEGAADFGFPVPESLASLEPDALRELGFSRQKSRAITELASAAVEGLDLEALSTLSDEDALAMLYQLSGVGRWTAEYVLLRGLGRTHIFPGDDVGARRELRRWLGLEEEPDYDQLQPILDRFAPYAGLIYFHLLLHHLDEAGLLQ